MPRKKVTEQPFVSIEEDASILGMTVQHRGMTERQAKELSEEINSLGLDIDTEVTYIPGTGRKQYMPEGKHHPPLANERDYIIVDARYGVVLESGDSPVGVIIQNAGQWRLWQRTHDVPKRLKKTSTRDLEDFRELDRRFQEETGVPLSILDLIPAEDEDGYNEYNGFLKNSADSENSLPENDEFGYLNMLEAALEADL